jgi:lipopolysaccharide transport system permease protein
VIATPDASLAKAHAPLRLGGLADAAAEVWAYRDLLLNLVMRDLSVRYRRSVLGFAWSFLNPLLMMLVFAIVFQVVKPLSVRSYPLFVLAGLLPWMFLAGSLTGAVRSITANAHLIDKVYFPREILPLSVVLANLVNFLLSLAVFMPLAWLLGAKFSAWTLALPVVIAVQLLLVSGLAFLLAALNVFYRDTELVLDVAITAWFFLTPIFYELELLPNQFLGIDVWRFVYTLNPMATLVTDYRYILLYQYPVIRHTLVPAVLGLCLFFAGWLIFRRVSPVFSEEV